MGQPANPSPTSNSLISKLDVYAASIAGFCLLHCLALPVLIAALPFALLTGDSHWLHQLLVFLAAPATLWVIWSARPGHLFSAAATAGLSLLLAAAFIEVLHDIEAPITVAGSILLGAAHLWHWYQNRSNRTGEDHQSEHERLPQPR